MDVLIQLQAVLGITPSSAASIAVVVVLSTSVASSHSSTAPRLHPFHFHFLVEQSQIRRGILRIQALIDLLLQDLSEEVYPDGKDGSGHSVSSLGDKVSLALGEGFGRSGGGRCQPADLVGHAEER